MTVIVRCGAHERNLTPSIHPPPFQPSKPHGGDTQNPEHPDRHPPESAAVGDRRYAGPNSQRHTRRLRAECCCLRYCIVCTWREQSSCADTGCSSEQDIPLPCCLPPRPLRTHLHLVTRAYKRQHRSAASIVHHQVSLETPRPLSDIWLDQLQLAAILPPSTLTTPCTDALIAQKPHQSQLRRIRKGNRFRLLHGQFHGVGSGRRLPDLWSELRHDMLA